MRDSCTPFKVICLESNEEFILGEPLEEDASFQNQNNVCEVKNPAVNKEEGVNEKNILEDICPYFKDESDAKFNERKFVKTKKEEAVDDKNLLEDICLYFKDESDAEFKDRKIVHTKTERSGDDFFVKKKPDEYDKKVKWASTMPTKKLVPSLKTEEKYTDHLSCLDSDTINNLSESHHTVESDGSNKNNQEGKRPSLKADSLPIEIDDDNDDETNLLKQNKTQNTVNNSLVRQPQKFKSKKASNSTTTPTSFFHTITNAIFKSADKRLHVASLLTCLPLAQHPQAVELLKQSRRFVSLPRGWWTLHPAIITRMSGGQTHTGEKNKVGEQKEVSKSVIDSPAQQSEVLAFINPSTCNQAETNKSPVPTCIQLNCTKQPATVINTEKALATHCVKNVAAYETTREVEDSSDVDCERSQVCDSPGPVVNQTRKYTCKHCGISFEFRNRLTRHLKTVHGTSEFLCSICCEADKSSYSYSSKASLALHIQLAHSNSNERQQCGKCGRSYKNAVSLKNHIRVVHTVNSRFSGRVSCSICHKLFASKEVMKRHQIQMHKVGIVKDFTCNDCLKTFHVKEDLRRHLMITHMEPELACSQCPQKFHVKDRLQRHVRAEHGIEYRKTFICDICGKSFKGKTTLATHLLIHKGIKKYICSVCGKHFLTDSGLGQHARTHSDERRFSCHLCNKAFRIKHHLRQHMSVHGLASTPDYRKRRRSPSSTSSSDE